MKSQSRLTPSSRRTPCPICGRNRDGDCRISDELVLCHYGKSKYPPEDMKSGDVIDGLDGRQWAFTNIAADGRTAVFALHKPQLGFNRKMKVPSKVDQPRKLEVARLPDATEPPPVHLPDQHFLQYSATQLVIVERTSKSKKFIPHHLSSGGQMIRGAGDALWPLWGQDDAINYGKGKWVFEAEGEKCADWFRAAGVVAVSQPGHDQKNEKIQSRYQRLLETGIAGVLYLADNDATGRSKAQRCLEAATAVGLQFLVLHASEVWPGLAEGCSIDDAPGSANERLAAVIAAIPLASSQPDLTAFESRQRSWRELLNAMLKSIVNGDDDESMELRAEAINRFRRTDPQIEAALFKLHAEQQVRKPLTSPPESLDLSRISGMDWLVEGFIPDNDQTMIWGNAGSGKTTAALAAACSVLQGKGLLDHTQPSPIGNVLFIASDSGAAPLYAAMQDMGMAELSEVKEGPEKRFHVWASDPDQGMTAWAADLRGCIQLLDFIKRNHIRLVLIDSCKAVCSGAGLDYANNLLVTALLTYFKEVICPHAAVVWLNHDGTAKGANAGAKAWKEVPSMVHRIIREENKDGSFINNRRHWRVIKSRMGQTREFFYELCNGDLQLCAQQETFGNCIDRVIDVLKGALLLEGKQSLQKTELVKRICMPGGPSRKTLDNTLSTATRAKEQSVCRAARGRYKLAPRLAEALKACEVNGKEELQIIDEDCDLTTSPEIPEGSSPISADCPKEESGKSSFSSAGRRKQRVSPTDSLAFIGDPSEGMVQVVLRANLEAVGSGADVFDDEDDPSWGPRPDCA